MSSTPIPDQVKIKEKMGSKESGRFTKHAYIYGFNYVG